MDIFKKISKWDIGVLIIIFIELFLLLLHWEMFPKFVDIYYHFSVAKAFDLANGIVLHDFWEYAPMGRPHLYPPLFHILILFFMKISIKTEFLMKLISFLMFPILQVTSWIVFRKGEVIKWKCRNCGYIHEGEEAPELCPACKHSRAYYEVWTENY